MSDKIKTMSLYFVQSPDVVFPNDDKTRGYNRQLLRYYRNSIPVKNILEFVSRVHAEVAVRKRLIKKLIIGSHGGGAHASAPGSLEGLGFFNIGNTFIMAGVKEIQHFRMIAPYLVKEADVYIIACQTGHAGTLLQQVSIALGGVRVHGYTDYITMTSYGPFGVSLDDGTDDEGNEIVCVPGTCRVAN